MFTLILLSGSLVASGCDPFNAFVKRKQVYLQPGQCAIIANEVRIPVIFRDKKDMTIREGYVKAHNGWLIGPPLPDVEVKEELKGEDM